MTRIEQSRIVNALGALILGHIVLLAALSSAPFLDLPNHLARATVVADLLLDGGKRFGQTFTFEWRFAPYILSDVALVGLVHGVGSDIAARLWMIANFLCIPAALWVYLRATGATPWGTAVAIVLSLFLSADWFYLSGFGAYRQSIAVVLLTLAVAHPLFARFHPIKYAALIALSAACYTLHLSGLLFMLAGLGVIAGLRVLRREVSIVLAAAVMVPGMRHPRLALRFQPGRRRARRMADAHPQVDALRQQLRALGARPRRRDGGRLRLLHRPPRPPCRPVLAQPRA